MQVRKPPLRNVAVLALLVALAGPAIGANGDLLASTGRAEASTLMRPYDEAGPRGPQGPPGPQGSKGRRGPQGERVVQVVQVTHTSAMAEWAAAAVAALATILAFFGARNTIRENRRIAGERVANDRLAARERITYESIARLGAPELIESKAVMSSFLRGGLQPPDIPDAAWADMGKEAPDAAPGLWRHLNKASSLEDRRTMHQILAFPNMLERLASMYNHKLLEEGIVKTMVEWEAKSFWKVAAWWIEELQEADPNTFKDTEVMLHKLAMQARPSPYES